VADMIDSLVLLARTFCESRSLSLARVSTLVFNDGAKLSALEAGECDIGTKRLGKAVLWFSANWPDGAVWPENVARPDSPLSASQERSCLPREGGDLEPAPEPQGEAV
jgi:hypothetical protein